MKEEEPLGAVELQEAVDLDPVFCRREIDTVDHLQDRVVLSKSVHQDWCRGSILRELGMAVSSVCKINILE
jgi:hypothetical protein